MLSKLVLTNRTVDLKKQYAQPSFRTIRSAGTIALKHSWQFSGVCPPLITALPGFKKAMPTPPHRKNTIKLVVRHTLFNLAPILSSIQCTLRY
ncbi:hypothetical protein PoB_002987800 [Plakobranchus ocellatus]|uniref:Uncharacterized protein n=1 Tax=Plakobranchus ocellatus TaxID=259542 RepID=A0AAV4A9Q6_9GAST|nr:hypothetical protein PoB_002987800 [Plakobranchus ocellatus]